jgi:hypothetical protein
VVGGQDYVFREVRRRLDFLKIDVAGHAKVNWQPPFSWPKYTTHLLIVEDDCPPALRLHAERVGKKEGVTVLAGPARNHWGEVEELLQKHGLVDVKLPPSPAPVPTNEEPKVTIADALAARGEQPPTIAPVEEPPPPEPAPPPPPKPAPPPPPVLPRLAEPTTSTEPATKRGIMDLPLVSRNRAMKLELAEKILLEKKGRVNNVEVLHLIHQKLGKRVGGLNSRDWRDLREKHRLPFPPQGGFKDGLGVATPPRRALKTTERPRPQRSAAPTNHVAPASAGGDDFSAALRAALEHVKETVLVPFYVSDLQLRWEKGAWNGVQVTRAIVQQVSGSVEL